MLTGEIYGQVAYSLRKGDALSISRAQARTADNLKEYYDLLKTTLEHQGPPKVVAPKGIKKVHCRTSGSKAIIACANAAGSVILSANGDL